MRLLRVELIKSVSIAGALATFEYEAADRFPLNYDPATDMVAIGPDGEEVPRSWVLKWKRDRSRTPPLIKAQCPECQREFNDNRALGAHRHKAHGVNGTTRQR